MTPSKQQRDIIEWTITGTGSAIVRARAGTGKTTTAIAAMAKMNGRVAYLVFNKKMADEAEGKVEKAGIGRNVVVGTFHKFGFDAWRIANAGVKVENKKTAQILAEFEAMGEAVPAHFHTFARQAASLAKQSGFGLVCRFNDPAAWMNLVEHYDLDTLIAGGDLKGLGDPEFVVQEACRAALRVLRASIQRANKVIDFDDMIYMPLLANARMPVYPWIVVDEAQDTNPVRRMMAKKMLKPGGRAIFVGDDRQAIYGFTGASADALDQVRRDFGARTLPLTVTYRCPKAVVAEAREIVEDYEAHADAPEGVVRYMTTAEFDKLAEGDLGAGDVVICRNVAPLVDSAFSMIRRNIACRVEGRSIGESLLKLMDRFSVKALPALVDKLDAYLERKVSTWMAKGEEEKADALTDQVETLKVIIQAMPPESDGPAVRAKIAALFQDLPDGSRPLSVVLMTAHRSKGLEFPRVFLLGRNKYMPSRFARQEHQLVQESNLEYVAITRAERELVYVDESLPPSEREARAAAT